MGKGRKPNTENLNLNWKDFFNKNVGIYLQQIIIELGKLNECGQDEASVLYELIKKNNTKQKNILPNIDAKEVPFKIPNNWVWCRLGEIVEFTENLNIETKFTKDTLINYVDIDSIDNKNYIIRDSKIKPVSELSSRARRVLKKGQILYSLVRPYLNNIAIVEEDKSNYIGSTGFAVFSPIEIDSKYLKYILLSDYVRKQFLSMLSGFNSPTISFEQFITTPIPLPPIKEQNKILKFLDDFEAESLKAAGSYFDERIEKNILQIHNSQLTTSLLCSELSYQLNQLELLTQAILQEAVQGKLVPQNPKDEPASELLKRIKEEKAKAGKKEKPLPPIKPEEIPFDIPENWVWCRLGEICNKITDGFHNTPKKLKEGKIYISATHIRENGIKWDECLYVSDKDYLELYKKTQPKKGEILITNRGAGCGTPVIIDIEDAFCFQNAAIIGFNQKLICSKFIYFFILKSRAEIMRAFVNGGLQPMLSNVALSKIPIPLAPISDQKRIVNEIDKQLEKTKQLKEHIQANQQATEQLLKALLHESFMNENKVS